MKKTNIDLQEKPNKPSETNKGLSKNKGWIEEHMILSTIAGSVIFAIVVHILYKIPAPHDWFYHEWEAGDVLTYVSTVALGLLAVWQNKKFKEANDKAQKEMDIQNTNAQMRLERINREANEIKHIGIIIDTEKHYLETVETALNNFVRVAGFASMVEVAFSDKKIDDLHNLRHQIHRQYEAVLHLLSSAYVVQEDKSLELDRLCMDMYKLSGELIDTRLSSKKINEDQLNHMGEIDNDITYTKLLYISARQMVLNMIMFESCSLESVRSIYTAPRRERKENEERKSPDSGSC